MGLLALVAVGLTALTLPACGGGSANGVTGRGLVLLSFDQSGFDNTVLNEVLLFRFSEPVDASTVSSASIQIREGDQFGATVPGTFITNGSTVRFEPVLASLCDFSDSALKPDTQYRVQMIGHPAEFSLRNTEGQPLNQTATYEFHTRLETDPDRSRDAIPGSGPIVQDESPKNGTAGVAVAAGNRMEVLLSENVDPCTVNADSVRVYMYESGDAAVMSAVPLTSPVRYSGFAKAGDVADQTPGDPFTWGADGTNSYAAAPRRILCHIQLVQDFAQTRIVITPLFGYNADPLKNAAKFPENALIVVQLDFAIADYGGLPMVPYAFAFTTENLATQTDTHLIANEGETPYIDAQTTAAVDPDPRSPSRVQGFMLFAGDGDNGPNLGVPTLPQSDAGTCANDFQVNDGITDDFDPIADTVLDTGATPNTCANSTDGSTAVIWEFNTFRIRNGVTVRIVGVNPAILLVSGDVVIENGGRLLAHGDGNGGSPAGRGQNGKARYTSSNWNAKGGIGVAGGGKGGDSGTVAQAQSGSFKYGQDGFAGYGASNYDPTMNPAGAGHGGEGAGGAGAPSGTAGSAYNPWDGGSAGGGGGGHAAVGIPGEKKIGTVYVNKKPARSFAGGMFGDTDSKMAMPEAGSGGGSSGAGTTATFSTSSNYGASGAGGGAGGGFVDLTSGGSVVILGGIYAVGGRGGNGDGWSAYGASAGAGGGAGGSIRILSPNNMVLGPTAVLSTAGGAGGTGYAPYSNANNRNAGGAGATGRIALEDDDSVISGLGAANVVPSEGAVGFYRGPFNAGRFQGGGLEPQAVTELVPVGNFSGFDPAYTEPVQAYGTQVDFKAGVPVAGSPGTSNTAILVEVRGYQMQPDGTADMATQTGWVSVGSFKDSGVEGSPTWFAGHPGDRPVPIGNTGGAGGFSELNGLGAGGFEILQFRFTMYLPNTVGPFDPGAFIDDWLVRFTHDQ